MTVTTTLDRQYFDGDGSNKVFPFNFRFFTNDQIYVSLIAPDGTITLQNLTTNYTLSGALQAGGGTVTMLVAPPLTVPATRVFIQRILPQVQPTSIRNQGKFYPEIHEDAFDRLTMLIQQALSGLSNSLQKAANGFGWDFRGLRGINVGTPVNGTDVATKAYVDGIGQGSNSYADLLNSKTVRTPEVIGSLPGAEARAGKYLLFDANGNPMVGPVSSGPVTDASSVSWARSQMDSAIATAKQMLDAQSVNIWEFAGYITSKQTADPSTWDWTPATDAATAYVKANGGGVVRFTKGVFPHTRIIRRNTVSLIGEGSAATYITALPFAPGGIFGMIEIEDGAVTSSHMKGMHVLGSAAVGFGQPVVNPTQWGMYIKAKWDSAYTAGGLWLSNHEDLRFSNFNFGLWSRGGYTNNNFLRPIQFLKYDQCFFQVPTGGEAVRFTGQHGQISFSGGSAEGRDAATALRCLTLDYDPDPSTMADNASGRGESTADVAGVGQAIQSPFNCTFGEGFSMQKSQEGVFARIAKGNTIRDAWIENIGKCITLQATASLHVKACHLAKAADGALFGSPGNGYLWSISGNGSLTFADDNDFAGSIGTDNYSDPASSLNNMIGAHILGGVTGSPAGKFKYAGFKSLSITTSTVELAAHRFAVVNSGADRSIKLTTLNSTAAPGELVHIRPSVGPITLGSGGNISLNGLTELTIPANGILSLMRLPQVGSSGEWAIQAAPDHFGTSEPSNGFYYSVGTRIWRSNPSSGSFAGWVCTTAGLAGSTAVFKTMANLAS